MASMFVKPIAGATVQFPGSMTVLPQEGAEVSVDTYWLRKVRDGSVVIFIKAEEVKSEAAVESATKNTRRG